MDYALQYIFYRCAEPEMFQMMKLPSVGHEVILKHNKSCCHHGFLGVLPELRKNFLVSTCCKSPTVHKNTCLDAWWFLVCGFPAPSSSCGPSRVVGQGQAPWGVGFFISFFFNAGYFEGNSDLTHFSLCILTQLEGGMSLL